MSEEVQKIKEQVDEQAGECAQDNRRAAMCLWCSKHIEIDPDNPQAAIETMRNHDTLCPASPTGQAITMVALVIHELSHITGIRPSVLSRKFQDQAMQLRSLELDKVLAGMRGEAEEEAKPA